METISNNQLDMFEGRLFPEFVQSEKIRLLEERQETLRRGLFRRWNDQEKKIKTLTESLSNVLSILEKE